MSNWRGPGRAAGIVGVALLLASCGVFDPGAAGRNSAPLSPASMATATSTPATSTGALVRSRSSVSSVSDAKGP